MQKPQEVIKQIKVDSGQRPREATTIVKFLNYKSREELHELGIQDRTKTILEVKTM